MVLLPSIRCYPRAFGLEEAQFSALNQQVMNVDNSVNAKTIFLVDDDSSAIDLYSRRLNQAGFRTASAFGAQEAFEALPTLSADLIILDLMVPKAGGIDLLRAIRSDSRHKNTPVLLLSNAYLPEMAKKGLKAGGSKALARSACTSSELVSISRDLAGVASSGTEESGAATLTEQLKADLIEAGNQEVAAIRQLCSGYVELAGSEAKEHLHKVYRSIRLLNTRAALAGCEKIAQLTGAIEAMLFEQVSRSSGGMSASSIQTLVKAVDCLDRLFTSGDTGSGEVSCKARVLLVDDDGICNMANEVALKRVDYDTMCVSDGYAALNLLNEQPFDLILLDIDMPGMDGVEVCQELRRIPQHKNTPVIFVTLQADFQTRAQTLLSGGDDSHFQTHLPG